MSFVILHAPCGTRAAARSSSAALYVIHFSPKADRPKPRAQSLKPRAQSLKTRIEA